jgi:hypothetical protein
MKTSVFALSCLIILMACSKPQEETTATTPAPPPEPPQAEIGDARYAEIGKQGLAHLASGDIDTWMNAYADNARYLWNAGDSLVGKEAIAAYWKDRRSNVIETITFTNDIWTPLKVNKPQKGPDRAGMWLLGWYQVNTTYKNGVTMGQWIHTDMHFDANDKIDLVVQYIDRAPINAALAKKK